jgi:predicted enzyme related to lactoylglutathione lyase
MIPGAYRRRLRDRRARLLLTGLGASSLGGPLVGSLGASATLAIPDVATLLLAAAASVLWTGERARSARIDDVGSRRLASSGIENWPVRNREAGVSRWRLGSVHRPHPIDVTGEIEMKIGLTSIYVDDQEKALRFYTDVLGFVPKTDVSQGPYRWLTVAPTEEPDAIELQLAANDDPAARAYQQALFARGERAIMFYVDDVQREFDRLTAAGAEFTMPPTKVTGSTIVVLNDTVGNLVQLTKLDRWQ